MRKFGILGAVSGLILAVTMADATTALAKPAAPRGCSDSDVSPTASACVGWYSGNLLGGSPADNTATANDLNTLLGVSTYNSSNVDGIASLSSLNGATTIDFGKTLFGDTVVGFHNGRANGQDNNIGAEGSAFFLIDFANPVTSFTLNVPGSSDARLFSTEPVPTGTPGGVVPEPAEWSMMMVGVAVLGASLRMRRNAAAVAV
jgi:hypothetical protein